MIAREKQSRYTPQIFFMIVIGFFAWHVNSEITLVYLDIYDQPINCLVALNLVSRNLYKA